MPGSGFHFAERKRDLFGLFITKTSGRSSDHESPLRSLPAEMQEKAYRFQNVVCRVRFARLGKMIFIR